MTNAITKTPTTRVEQKIEKERRRYYLKMNLRSLYACFKLGRNPSGGLRFVFMMGESQDIWHVLTALGTDEFDEVALQAFYAGQFPNSTGAIIAVAAFLKSILRGRFDELNRHIDSFAEGFCAGKRSGSLVAVKWEEHW